jgi:hypothetical protein
MPAKQVVRTERTYTPEQVDQALMTLLAIGNSVKAAEVIEDQFGFEIPAKTLRDWRRTRHDRYFELARKHGEELETKAIDTKRALLPLLADGIALGVEKTIEELEAGDAKDPSASARNLAVISGIETRDLLTLTGRPNSISVSLTPEQMYQQLAELFEGTAEEIEDAEVVEETERSEAATEQPPKEARGPAIRRATPSQRDAGQDA